MNAKKEVDDNFNFFKTQLSDFKKNHLNQYALLHKKQVSGFYESENDAIQIGMKDYGEGCFSVQKVASTNIELGYQSYVIF
ncbi:MAG: hypothetical protein DRQ51_05810 [Gammaproteobacteria bacterium]|nr:MAG: hypothetical protein DRQ51_05810 [Gammaproteobacteria bacterium]